MTCTTTMADPAAFVEQFAEAWATPRVDRFVEMLHPDVRLRQPITPTVHGRNAARDEFSRLLEWLPDITGAVDHWAVDGSRIFIEWRLRAIVGGRELAWPIVDRIVLEDGLIRERVAYFDGVPLLLAILRDVRGWPRAFTFLRRARHARRARQ